MRYLETTPKNCTIEEYFKILREEYGKEMAYDLEEQILVLALEDFSSFTEWCEENGINWRAMDNEVNIVYRWLHNWV